MRLLDGPDLFHLAQERPDQPMHTLKVAVLERPVDERTLGEWAERTLPSVEPLRWRVARTALARPVLVDEGPPDLDQHLRRIALDQPATEDDFVAVLSGLCSGPALDRSRPLWALWHVVGLAGDRDALVFQLHHVLADGQGSVALWEALADGADR